MCIAPTETNTVSLREFFLAKVDREAALVRQTLERVPDGRSHFRPHDGSMELGYLASMVAGALGWIPSVVERDHLDLNDSASAGFRTQRLETRADLIAHLEAGIAAARRSLERISDNELMEPWAFRMGGRTVMEQPRHVMLADAVFSHLAHHRGQLTVYLRLAESPAPGFCLPTTDEIN